MRYSLYSNINNMIDTLMEAVNYIEQNQNTDMSIHLLINCNEVINSVEKVLFENSKSITDLKIFELLDACENQVDELINLIQTSEDYDVKLELLDNNIKQLQILFQNNVHFRYRIVFFAELGQKWDSMNSVYEAFKKRIDCEVRVVLTPIFREVHSEGKVERDIIYEDYLTPMGIEYIPYKKYNLEKDTPDMAFISNPYESVTLPQFWPENIAKHTKLVYLPYYTGMKINQEDIQVNCEFPIAKYAWKIIAQSQKMKDIHKKFAPQKGDNVLVTGLPKWDEIFKINKKSIDKELSWKKKLDGRKVFLWNSHYSIGSHTSTLLEYGKEVIELFSNRQDVALIWRPHPMTETIFRLYLLKYKPLWRELKDKVEISDNMILDTNSSFKSAFYYSDALISDYSSVIPEYMMTKKPILWTKKLNTNEFFVNADWLIRIESLEQSYSIIEISDFIDRITKEIDSNKNIRMQIIKEDIPHFNGEIGEEICALLLEDFHKEIN